MKSFNVFTTQDSICVSNQIIFKVCLAYFSLQLYATCYPEETYLPTCIPFLHVTFPSIHI